MGFPYCFWFDTNHLRVPSKKDGPMGSICYVGLVPFVEAAPTFLVGFRWKSTGKLKSIRSES